MKKTLGMLISQKRKEKGMTQLELAQKMGVTDKAVSKWERDLSCPDINSLPVLAETLGVSISELMQVKEKEPAGKSRAKEIVDTVLKAVAVAMGIAVVALSVMDAISPKDAVAMLGVGLASLAIAALKGNNVD